MLSQTKIKKIFQGAQAIITNDHFVYAIKEDGWYHGPDYVNKDAIYPYRRSVKTLCREIAENFANENPEVIIGPTIGAISLKDAVADYLAIMLCREILAICADEEDLLEEVVLVQYPDGRFVANGNVMIMEDHSTGNIPTKIRIVFQQKTGTKRIIKRGYDKLVKGKRGLLVEDVINSGATLQKTALAAKEAGVIVVGAGALCNRSGGKVTAETLGVPKLFSLLDLDMKMYKEEECPICKERGPESVRTDLGKGKDFLARIGK